MDEQIISDRLLKSIQTMGNPEAYKGSTEEQYGTDWFGEVPAYNSAQWDHVFSDGAMFKHGNIGQGIYVIAPAIFVEVFRLGSQPG